jgi:hypothetical protein
MPNIGSLGVNSVDGGRHSTARSATAPSPAHPQPPVAGERNGIVSYLITAPSGAAPALASEARAWAATSMAVRPSTRLGRSTSTVTYPLGRPGRAASARTI